MENSELYDRESSEEKEADFFGDESEQKEINAQKGLAQLKLFKAAYPDVNLQELMNDEEFIKYTENTSDPLITAYEIYISRKKDVSSSKESACISTGSVRSSGRASAAAYFTRDEVMSMTPSQVRKNLDKIHKSIPKWKI